ncbi:unnamed protein product [Amoebophrya sp. A120]|nr:unnamed protein product [Amoebophrya sp. A120]|eukprot:GSA120T00010388001.1
MPTLGGPVCTSGRTRMTKKKTRAFSTITRSRINPSSYRESPRFRRAARVQVPRGAEASRQCCCRRCFSSWSLQFAERASSRGLLLPERRGCSTRDRIRAAAGFWPRRSLLLSSSSSR